MKGRLQALLLTVLIAAGAAAWLSAGTNLYQPPHPVGGLTAALGRPPGFELVNQDGRTVLAADFDGKVKLVFFGFTVSMR